MSLYLVVSRVLKNQLSKGYLYTTTKLQTDFAEAVQHPDYPICHILHTWKHPDDRESSEKEKINDISSILECDLPLRDYQKEALDELQDYDEGILALHIPCGLGKTLIAGHFLKYSNKNFIIMIAPLKVSVENLYDRLSCFFPDYDSLIVDSDTNGTTDEKEINEFITQKQKKIIYSTYKSSIEILSEMKLDLSDAIVLADEIHRANTELCEFIKQFPIGLVMSATLPEEIENELIAAEKKYNLINYFNKFKEYENKLKNKNDQLNYLSYIIEYKIKNYKDIIVKITNLKKNFLQKLNEYIKIISYDNFINGKNKNLNDNVYIILINHNIQNQSINSNILLSIYINKIKFSNNKFQKHMDQYGIKINIPNIKNLEYLNLDKDALLLNGLFLINFSPTFIPLIFGISFFRISAISNDDEPSGMVILREMTLNIRMIFRTIRFE